MAKIARFLGEPSGAKTVILALLAAASVAFVTWLTFDTFRDRPPRSRMIERPGASGSPGGPGSRQVERDPDELRLPDMAGTHTFTTTKSASAAQAAGEAARSTLADLTRLSPTLASLPGQERFAEDAAAVFQSFLANDESAYWSHIDRVGGRQPQPPEQREFAFQRLAKAIGYASIDTSRITVEPVKTGAGADPFQFGQPGSMMMNRMMIQNEGEDERTISILKMRPPGVFPDMDEFVKAGRRAVEVRAPLRTDGSNADAPEMHLGIVMAWDPRAKAWQPLIYNLYVYSDAVLQGIMPRRGG